MLKIYHLLPFSRFFDGSYDEIASLFEAFGEWKRKSGIPTPRLDDLERRLLGSR